MKKNNKTCIVCGEKYTYCNTCEDFYRFPTWMSIYHNENCKELFNIASDYLANAINKNEAVERLNKCDLSYKDKLHKEILKVVNELTTITKNTKVVTEDKVAEKNNTIEENKVNTSKKSKQ